VFWERSASCAAATTDRPPAWWGGGGRVSPRRARIVRELLLSASVACDPVEAEQVIAWGRAHPAWTDDPQPLYAFDPERDEFR
jgi:hypothetical protein